ncbi:MAG: hypothetical protein EOP47_23915 [Sphingobacteriaceae bacterium]|nr:MAG: hypothetical protein EOP47_23915 [Sphingobacteriaceae bacterium]
MKHLYFILLIAALPLAASSQANYHEGFVVKLHGDTLRGYVNYRNWSKSPGEIEFRVGQSDIEALKFKPFELKEVTISGFGRYVTYEGDISIDNYTVSDMPDGLDTTTKKAVVFLREVYRGDNASLFSYVDNIKERFFVVEKGKLPVELKYHKYYTNTRGGSRRIVELAGYKDQLAVIANKYVPEQSVIDYAMSGLTYSENDLEIFFRQINPNHVEKRTSRSFWFFAGVGIDRITTTTNQFSSRAYSNVNYTPKLSVGFDVSSNPDFQRFIFRVELAFWYAKHDFTKMTPSGVTPFMFNQYNVALTPQLLWNAYISDALKYYVGVGATVNFSHYSSATVFYLPEPVWFSPYITTGVVLNKRIDLHLDYSPKLTSDGAVFNSFTFNTLGVGLKYRFGK